MSKRNKARCFSSDKVQSNYLKKFLGKLKHMISSFGGQFVLKKMAFWEMFSKVSNYMC